MVSESCSSYGLHYEPIVTVFAEQFGVHRALEAAQGSSVSQLGQIGTPSEPAHIPRLAAAPVSKAPLCKSLQSDGRPGSVQGPPLGQAQPHLWWDAPQSCS